MPINTFSLGSTTRSILLIGLIIIILVNGWEGWGKTSAKIVELSNASRDCLSSLLNAGCKADTAL
jgi:hypothetical protein